MSKILALYDSDSIYATRFMEYFKNNRTQEWEVSAFTREDSLEAFLKLHKAEILLLGTQLETIKLPDDRIGYCYRYTEDSREEYPENFIIYKYQPAEQVMEKLLNDYRRRQYEGRTDPTGSVNLISIFSLRNNPQDSLFAWSVAFQLAKEKNVLLLTLELLTISFLPFLEQTKCCLSDLIYYLKENSNPELKLKELVSYCNNLSYLPGAAHGYDLLSLNTEDVRQLIEILRRDTKYQTVIFYLGNYQEAGTELMRQGDEVILLSGKDAIDRAVYTEWMRQMNCIGIDPEQEKFHVIYPTKERRDIISYRSMAELSASAIWHQTEEYLLQA